MSNAHDTALMAHVDKWVENNTNLKIKFEVDPKKDASLCYVYDNKSFVSLTSFISLSQKRLSYLKVKQAGNHRFGLFKSNVINASDKYIEITEGPLFNFVQAAIFNPQNDVETLQKLHKKLGTVFEEPKVKEKNDGPIISEQPL